MQFRSRRADRWRDKRAAPTTWAVREFRHYPLTLLQQNTTVRQLFELASHMSSNLIESVVTCENFSTLFQFLLRTPLAMTICSAFSVLQEAEAHGLVMRSVDTDQLIRRNLQLQVPSGRLRSAALEMFLAFARQQLNTLDESLTI